MSEVRHNRRLARLMRGSIALSSGSQHYLLIQNVSRFGIGAKFASDRLRVGESVVITIPALGKFSGTIRWQNAGRIGVQINEPLEAEAIHFENDHLEVKDSSKYKVAERFQPVSTSWRPGFGRKK